MLSLLWDMEDIMSGQDTPENLHEPARRMAAGHVAGDPLRKSPVYPSQSSALVAAVRPPVIASSNRVERQRARPSSS